MLLYKLKRLVINVVSTVLMGIGWCLKWFIPKKLKQKIYHTFDELFEIVILKSICDGVTTKDGICKETNLPKFIVEDSVLRLKKKNLVDFDCEG